MTLNYPRGPEQDLKTTHQLAALVIVIGAIPVAVSNNWDKTSKRVIPPRNASAQLRSWTQNEDK